LLLANCSTVQQQQFVRDSECKRIKSVTFSMNYSAALQQ